MNKDAIEVWHPWKKKLVPFQYNSGRMDNLLEKYADLRTPEARSALWAEIVMGNEWHRIVGWHQAKEVYGYEGS